MSTVAALYIDPRGQYPLLNACGCYDQLKRLPVASKQLKRRTPPLFAEWLVSLARAAKPSKGTT